MRSNSGPTPSVAFADTTTVRIRLPARREQLGLVRSVAEAVSVDAAYTAEDIADIRLALNEVASALIVDAVPGSTLDCSFTYDRDRLSVEVTSVAWADDAIADGDIAWRIVRTLTTAATATRDPFDITVSGYPTRVEFDWQRDAPRTRTSPVDRRGESARYRVVHRGGARRATRPANPRGGTRPVDVRSDHAVARALHTRDERHGSDMTATSTAPTGGLVHPAMFYDGDEDYVAGLLPFVLDGITLGEPVAVAAPLPRLRLLREALGARADAVRMIDMTEAGRNPGRIIPGVLRAFADEHIDKPVRIIGEPIWAGRSALEYPACVQHEALINQAFEGRDITIVCPYDRAGLDATAIADAAATHPLLWEGEHRRKSEDYAPEAVLRRYNQALAEPADAAEMIVAESADVSAARRWAVAHAGSLAEDAARIADLELVVTELATNGLCHGVGPVRLRMWSDGAHLVCAVHDHGSWTDPQAGRRPARAGEPGGRGLLLVHQLCDLVRTHTGEQGTTQYALMAA
ncbi:anti-sigma factor RsbA family regulatory protein [Nocardia arizonensis]|uniref:anti-sigma factor RsbA family regulatory protein n=1 Tax=Nocardia arizonensis TaxID=1141647 RepID=UPI000B26908D|nr:anti-sigma factor RsbA family regulatory protein [Nocardia arizonensis]